MDVVIPLGTGSTWDNTELRYALRSLEMFYKRLNNVYLVGEKPHWIKKGSVIHLHCIESKGIENKERNIRDKVMLACHQSSLSEDFIFMNDDHFLLAPLQPLPRYRQNTLEVTLALRSAHDSYYQSLNNTLQALQSSHRSTFNYDIHCPIIYNKAKFKKIMSFYDWSIHYGYVIKSLYCNTVGYRGVPTTDLKINQRYSCSILEQMIKDRKFFSIADGATGAEMGTFLQYLYKEKSSFEV